MLSALQKQIENNENINKGNNLGILNRSGHASWMIQLDSNQIRFPQSANLNILKTAPILPFTFRFVKILSGTVTVLWNP